MKYDPLLRCSKHDEENCIECASDLIEKLYLELEDSRGEAARYRQRLDIDDGGSDKIDELEAALVMTRHRLDTQAEKLTSIVNSIGNYRETWKAFAAHEGTGLQVLSDLIDVAEKRMFEVLDEVSKTKDAKG